ncbi:MAG: peptide chain release factor 2 [bacterium]
MYYEEYDSEYQKLKVKIENLRGYLDIEGKQKRLTDLDQKMGAPDFWSNNEAAQTVIQERSALMEWVEKITLLEKELEELEVAIELGQETDDAAMAEEIKDLLKSAQEGVNELEIEALLSDEDDHRNAIISIHSGAGGTESQDWAGMLLRMYLRWIEKRKFKVQQVDLLPGSEAGIKSVTLIVSGQYAYGLLRGESGVHRLVRISPFDANRRRHTSFASVAVYPEVDENIEVEIEESDLRIDTFRSSGAGGQHVNVTDSAVRITHIPTGIVVQCQNERSQHQNRAVAMNILRARLYELEKEEQQKKRDALEEGKREIAWGSQIRSYIFQPYQLVKDHRTSLEIGNIEAVMNGEIDPFIQAYLRL